MIRFNKLFISTMMGSYLLFGLNYGAQAAESSMTILGDKVNVRQTAKTDGKVLETLNKEVEVEAIARSKEQETIDKTFDYWYQVKTASGKTGWVFGSFLTVTGSAMTLGEGVIVREKADRNGKQMNKLAKGATVEITNRTKQRETIGKASDYWYEVKTEAGKPGGWVFGGFLVKTGDRITTGQNLNVREQPNTKGKVVEALGEGAKVSVLERTKEQEKIGKVQDYWYQVKTASGKSGWVFGGFLMATD